MSNAFERIPELTTGISGLEPRVDGTPVKGAGWEEIAGALGKVSRQGADLIRAVYLHEPASLRRTRDCMHELAMAYGMSGGLRDSLVMATLHAFIAMRPCRFCHGEGRTRIASYTTIDGESGEETFHRAKWETCGACSGDGYDHVSASQVQLMMRVSVEVWEALLADAYREMYDWLREQHEEAKRILVRAVGKHK